MAVRDLGHALVLERLDELSQQLRDRDSHPLFIISSVKYDNYLAKNARGGDVQRSKVHMSLPVNKQRQLLFCKLRVSLRMNTTKRERKLNRTKASNCCHPGLQTGEISTRKSIFFCCTNSVELFD